MMHDQEPAMLNGDEITGADVLAVRRQLKMTQERFAQEIGVTVSSVNRWERGIIQPSRLAKRAIQALLERRPPADA